MKETSFFQRGAAHRHLGSRWSGVVAGFAWLWFSVAAQAIESDPITLAVGLNNPQDMVMDATTIYWTEYDSGSVKAVPKNGGAVVTVAGGLGPLTGLAADNASLYFVETLGNLASIKKVAKSGGGVSTLISDQPSIARVAVDGVSVYWTDFTSGAVRKVSIFGGSATTLVSGLYAPGGITVDSLSVYWTELANPGLVGKIGVNGDALTTLANHSNTPGITSDGNYLYWTEFDYANNGKVNRIPLNGGGIAVLATGLDSPWDLVVDGANVYWVERSVSGSVRQVNISGGTVLTLATGLAEPLAIAVDASRVYWIERYAVRSSAKGVQSPFSPPVITSSTFASGMVGVFFNYVTMAINSPTNYAAVGLPFGLAIDPVSGVITGIPTTGGDYSVMLTAKNAGGTDTKILNISIGNEATRIIGLSGDFAYGVVPVGSRVNRTLTIGNYGNSSLTVSGLDLPPGFTGQFTGVIPAGGWQYVSVVFAPSNSIPYAGSLTVNSDATSGINTIALSGMGTPPITRIISLRGDMNFGNVLTGTVAKRRLTIVNSGNSVLVIAGIQYPPGFSGDWSGGFIAAGGAQRIEVSFSPLIASPYGGIIAVSSDKTSGTDTLTAAGIGSSTPTPRMEVFGNDWLISDSSLTPASEDGTDWGTVDVIIGNPTRTFIIVNNGTALLDLTGDPKVLVNESSEFVVVTQPTSPVPANGGTAAFQVRFNPVSTGLKTATLSIASNDGARSPYDFAMQGNSAFLPEGKVWILQRIGTTDVNPLTTEEQQMIFAAVSGEATYNFTTDEKRRIISALNGVNSAPTISSIANQTTPMSTPTPTIPFVVADVGTPPINLSLTARSSNPTLVPDANIALGGAANSRTVIVTPAAGQAGDATITIRVTDGTGLYAEQSFVVSVSSQNRAPVLTVPASITVDEQTLLALVFVVNDPDLPAQTLTFELVSGPAGMTLGTTTGDLTWTPSESQGPGIYPVTVRVRDSGTPALSDTKSFTVVVNEIDIAPVISLSSNPANYTAGGQPVLVDDAATIADIDSADFNGGALTVDIVANGSADDRLTVRNQGVAAGQIGFAGGTVTFGGAVIGAASGGNGGAAPLLIVLNGNATATAVQALVRNITFASVSSSPSTLARSVRLGLTDGDGATSTPVTKSITVTFTVSNQTIVFEALTDRTWGDAPFKLSASASSGLPVSFGIVSGPATINADWVTITGVGAVVVRAVQPGNASFNPAPNVYQSFNVVKAGQTVQFAPLGNKMLSDSPFALAATSSSGLPVKFAVVSGPATITGNIITLSAGGTVTIRASQAGDDHFNAAADVDRSFMVSSANQAPAITLENPLDGETFKAPASFRLEARALDTDGTIATVEFFDGSTKIGEAQSAPYLFVWNNVRAGRHTIQARATDNLGASTLSLPVTVIVNPTLLRPELTANGMFRFALALEPGRTYTIQRSEDLRNWTPLASHIADASGDWQFVDSVPQGMRARFYRLVQSAP